MNEERDAVLESLFVRAERELVDEKFTARVMDRVSRRRRNVLIGRFAIVALLVAFEMLLSTPLQNSAGAVAQALSMSLIEFEGGVFAMVVGPINSVAGLIGLLLVGMHFLYRRMVH